MVREKLIMRSLLGVLIAGGCAHAAELSGDAALAMRLAELAQGTLRQPTIRPAHWKQAVALLRAAQALDPAEERYPRLLVDACWQLSDVEGAKQALKAYRGIAPNDHVAQVQLIDLYVSGIETADGQIAYLNQVAEVGDLDATVRSHVATALGRAYLAQSQLKAARQQLDEALNLNELNIDALRLRHRHFPPERSGDRTSLLVKMLRANPAQPAVMASLGREMEDAGLPDGAAEWYGRSLALSQGMGQKLSADLIHRYAIASYLSGQDKQAAEMAQQLVQVNAGDADAWLLALLAQRRLDDSGKMEALRRQADNALLNRLIDARRALGHAQAATRPLDGDRQAMPDLGDDVGRLRESGEEVRDAYIAAAANLVWFRFYFSSDPGDAHKLIEVLQAVLPEGHVLVTRLEGWGYLIKNSRDEAKVKLSAIADRDALAELGMIRIREQQGDEKSKVADAAGKVLREHPSGMVGAMLWASLRDLTPWPETSVAAEVRQAVKRLPKDWLSILDRPQQFYSVRIEPMRVSHEFSQPLWMKVTVRNAGPYDLMLGPEGVVRGDLWIDASVRRGGEGQSLPGIAYDRLGGLLVLGRNESVTRTFRLDQGPLAEMLKASPNDLFQISADVTTNPQLADTGASPGLAGQRATASQALLRLGVSLSDQATGKKVFELIGSGLPADKMRAADLLAAHVRMSGTEKGRSPASHVDEAMRALRQASGDPDPNVSAWVRYVMITLREPPEESKAIGALLKDANWRVRLLVLASVAAGPGELQHDLSPAEEDEHSFIRDYAAAIAERNSPALNRPTTNRGGRPPATRGSG